MRQVSAQPESFLVRLHPDKLSKSGVKTCFYSVWLCYPVADRDEGGVYYRPAVTDAKFAQDIRLLRLFLQTIHKISKNAYNAWSTPKIPCLT